VARQKLEFTIPGERSDKRGDRDGGKVFVLTEPDADKGERLSGLAKALLAEAIKVPVPSDDIGHAAGLASMGINFDDPRVDLVLLHPSLEPLWDCVKYQHDPRHPLQDIRKGENCQIEEIATRRLLRKELICLFLGFFPVASGPPTSSPPTSPSD
jgi:hypothetical protein